MTETFTPPAEDSRVSTLANGLRVLTLTLPQRQTVHLSVFVRTGGQHESRRNSGISHVVEHMAFKGTATRDCQRINLEAERLGAEVNAHTDKDHTAFHIDGLARDLPAFVALLGDIVRHSSFPEAELERERAVILHETTDDEEDAVSTAFKLFDQACWGDHACARPVIGNRRNIQRFRREELLDYVQQQYTATNIVVGVAGGIEHDAVVAEVDAAFGTMARGSANTVAAPTWLGGLKSRRLAGSAQTHVVLGFPTPTMHEDPVAHTVAAAVFGEGMSSPLLDQIRERRGLAYHAACSADVADLTGQFVIEASTDPAQVEALFSEVAGLLVAQTRQTDAVGLERARNQLVVRSLRHQERPAWRLETAAIELFVLGRLRSPARWREQVAAVTADEVSAAFRHMLAAPPAVALAGSLRQGLKERVRDRLALIGRASD
jgi:predicted Zn-dependent peptidase